MAMWHTCHADFSLQNRNLGLNLNRANIWKNLETFSLNDYAHDKEQSINTPWYNSCQTREQPNNDWGIIPISDWNPTALELCNKGTQGSHLCQQKQLPEHEDNHCWYAETQQWLESHDIRINAIPPIQYNLECPNLTMTKWKKIEWSELILSTWKTK